jgi:hypothetical protein
MPWTHCVLKEIGQKGQEGRKRNAEDREEQEGRDKRCDCDEDCL